MEIIQDLSHRIQTLSRKRKHAMIQNINLRDGEQSGKTILQSWHEYWTEKNVPHITKRDEFNQYSVFMEPVA